MLSGRSLKIAWTAIRLVSAAMSERLRQVPSGQSELPRRLRDALERLGPTFVKAGQTLSLREDLLAPAYVAELARLQDKVAPFPTAQARATIAASLGRPVEEMFASFDDEPLAAASIAQVHSATLADGTPVVVKVRRPRIGHLIDHDMKTLVRVLRSLSRISPVIAGYRPVELAREIWRNLKRETDFRIEARAMRRFRVAFAGSRLVEAPAPMDEMVTDAVLVQTRSEGRLLGDPELRKNGPQLARQLAEAYLDQFFVFGIFQGDPHPGNLFFRDDGPICIHDFGIFGELDRSTRRELAMLVQAFANRDAEWMVQSAAALGLLAPGNDTVFARGIEEILDDYFTRPLKEWSMGELLLRITRLAPPGSVRVPHDLLVLMRTLIELESALKRLDPDMNLAEMLRESAPKAIESVLGEDLRAGLTRLRYEFGLATHDLPYRLADMLHRARVEGFEPGIRLKVKELDPSRARLERTGNRLAIAVVTLGLYIASSLLMQHSIGPRLFGIPALALAGYLLAVWFTIRIGISVARSGNL